MHISEVASKTAASLAEADLDDDWYHNNIKMDAKTLHLNGYDSYIYAGQWSSGKTWWISGDGKSTVVGTGVDINNDNKIKDR